VWVWVGGGGGCGCGCGCTCCRRCSGACLRHALVSAASHPEVGQCSLPWHCAGPWPQPAPSPRRLCDGGFCCSTDVLASQPPRLCNALQCQQPHISSPPPPPHLQALTHAQLLHLRLPTSAGTPRRRRRRPGPAPAGHVPQPGPELCARERPSASGHAVGGPSLCHGEAVGRGAATAGAEAVAAG
jgi:hypothetical protein